LLGKVTSPWHQSPQALMLFLQGASGRQGSPQGSLGNLRARDVPPHAKLPAIGIEALDLAVPKQTEILLKIVRTLWKPVRNFTVLRPQPENFRMSF